MATPETRLNSHKESFSETDNLISNLDVFKRLISHPRDRIARLKFNGFTRTVAALGLAGIVAVTAITAGANKPAQADTLQRPPNPYTFTIDSTHQGKISISHGESGLPGSPNPPDSSVDRIYFYVNNVLTVTTQPNGTIHPALSQPWAVGLAVEGVLVDPAKNLVFMATSVGCNDRGLVCPDGIEEALLSDLGNYNARTMTDADGLPQDGSAGDPTSVFEFKVDGLGNSIRRNIINSIAGKNGSYRHNRDANTGRLTGKWWLPNFAFLPTISDQAQSN